MDTERTKKNFDQEKPALSSGFILQRALFRLTDRLYRAKSLREAYEVALDGITELLKSERASVLQFDVVGVMRFVAWRGLSESYRQAVDGHSPWKSGEIDPPAIFVSDIDETEESNELKSTIRREGIRALAFVPLMRNRSVAGKFMVYYADRHDFTEEEREIALLIARQVSFWIERETADLAAGRHRALIQSSRDAIIAKDLNGIIQTWNRGAELLFGYAAEEAIGRSITVLVPPDRTGEEISILARVRAGGQVDPYETVRRRKDGSLVPVSVTVSPITGSNGEILGASNITRNITNLVREREQRELLLREMNHRVKNLFAVATGIVNMSARTANSPEGLAATITERLTALGRAHSLTQIDPQSQHSVSIGIEELCRVILAPYDEAGTSRISFSGNNCKIEGNLITPLALLFHEFATNAAKHGSLSRSEGRVEIRCITYATRIELIWTEAGSNFVRPGSAGFGTRLVDATVAQLGGRIEHHWRNNGLQIKLELPSRI